MKSSHIYGLFSIRVIDMPVESEVFPEAGDGRRSRDTHENSSKVWAGLERPEQPSRKSQDHNQMLGRKVFSKPVRSPRQRILFTTSVGKAEQSRAEQRAVDPLPPRRRHSDRGITDGLRGWGEGQWRLPKLNSLGKVIEREVGGTDRFSIWRRQ